MAKNKNLSALEAQADFMRSTLEEMCGILAKEPLVVEYDNGGGQKGVRENPQWIAYEKLMKSYHATLRAIATQQEGQPKSKTTGIGSPLNNFRANHDNLKVVKRA